MGSLRAAVLLLLIPFCSAAGQTNALLVDTSKSMRPYYDSGLMKDLNHLIYGLLQPRGRIALLGFSTEVFEAASIDALSHPELGDWTYLDRAVDYALRRQYDTVWLVTDNVQSQLNDPEAANTAVFYQELRSQKITKIVIFPLLQPPGRSGLIVYALELAPTSDASFTRQISEFAEHAKGVYHTEPLTMKPLDSNTVELNFVKGSPGSLVRSAREYKVGQNIREDFQAHFKSRFEHLRITDAKVEVPNTKPVFSVSSLLIPEKREVTIDPERVISLDPQSESETYVVTIDLGKVKLKKDPISLWKAAWGKNYEELTLDVPFIVHVPQSSFRFKDSFIRDYSAATPEAAKATGKIYGLDQLPLLLSDAHTTISAKNSIALKVRYPWWPAIVWMVFFILSGLILIGFVRKGLQGVAGLKRRTGWTITATTPEGVPLSSVYDGERVDVQGDPVGRVQKGDVFIAASGVRLDGGSEKAKIEEDTCLKIEWKERLILLKFQRAEAPSKGSVRIPGKR